MPGLSGLLKRVFAAPRRLDGRAFQAGVERVARDLEHLNGSTERDFLAVGERLNEFRSMARRISSQMSALTELISGEQGRGLSLALDRTLDHFREMDAGFARGAEALESLAALSPRIGTEFAGLRETVEVFRTLCTLTRIETTRLGGAGAGFGDLAADVRPLSESIRASGEGILEASARLDGAVESALLRGRGLRATQLAELPPMIADVVESLRSFEERRARAVDASARQAVQYEALCGAVDGVVESLQFHDITRQQIEHVAQALRQILPGGARAILALQSSQLAGAAGVFAGSVERMERDLESIARRALEMAAASGTLMGISSGDQDSFFLRMEGRFTIILKALGVCAAAQGEMEQAAAGLKETIANMRHSVAEIDEIGIRIERIALNAMIRAAHIGAAGDALNVIAEAMQGLAHRSNAGAEDAARTLDAMSGAAVRVATGATVGANDVTARMRRAVLELHTSSEVGFARVNEIATLGARLAEDIGAARRGFSAGRLFAETAARAQRELERIGAQTGPGPAAHVPAPHWDSLAKRYTMQAERDVHQRAAESDAGETAAPVAAMANGDLGDNVELF